jgi:hypothetical protein
MLATLVPTIVDTNTIVFVFVFVLQMGSPWPSNQARDTAARGRLLWRGRMSEVLDREKG